MAVFCKIYKYLLLGKGYKSALYLWRKKSFWLQDFVWKHRTVAVFFTAELHFLIPAVRSRHSRSGSRKFICEKRKYMSFFNRNTCVQQEQISMVGVALGAVFIKKTRSNYPISLFGRMGILSRNSKIAPIITPKLLTCCKKAFLLASSRVQRKSFLQLAIRASWS